MLIIKKFASKYFETHLEVEITPREEESFQQSKVYWLCKASPLADDNIRDHDHLTGKYRGAAHNRCKSNCKKSQVPLFPYFLSIISVVMIVILYLKNPYHKLLKWGMNQKYFQSQWNVM